MHPNELTATLAKKDKGASEVRTVLARLVRTILRNLQITPAKFNTLMKGYLANPINGIAQNTKDRSSAQGNLTKALMREQVTWKTVEKLLILLRCTGFRLKVETLRHGDDEWVPHELSFEHFGAGYDEDAPEIDLLHPDFVTKPLADLAGTQDYYVTNSEEGSVQITNELVDVVAWLQLNEEELHAFVEHAQRNEVYEKGEWSVRAEGFSETLSLGK